MQPFHVFLLVFVLLLCSAEAATLGLFAPRQRDSYQHHIEGRQTNLSSDPGVAVGQNLAKSSSPDPVPVQGFVGATLGENQSSSPITPDLRQLIQDKTVPFAGATYCPSVRTGEWRCGRHCDANPDFELVQHGGNDELGLTPLYYVGWNPSSNEIVVAHAGSNFSRFVMLFNDFNIVPEALDQRIASTLERSSPAKLSSTPIEAVRAMLSGKQTNLALVHSGFQSTWERTFSDLSSAVLTVLEQHPEANSVFVTGHSLGAALALLDGLALRSMLPSTLQIQVSVLGQPRVGNPMFAALVDKLVQDPTQAFEYHHVVNNDDVVPHLAPRTTGYQHSTNEVFITRSNSTADTPTLLCGGNENRACALSRVSQLGTEDHGGPYLGIRIGGGPAGLCADA